MGSTPERYEHWLSEVVKRQRARLSDNSDGAIAPESLVFINAWNEWAEGNHLEPDQKWGRAYLEATRTALNPRQEEIAGEARHADGDVRKRPSGRQGTVSTVPKPAA